MKVGEDIYVFKITDVRSKNGYSFSKALTNATMIWILAILVVNLW